MDLLKNGLSNAAIGRIGQALAGLQPKFNQALFQQKALQGLEALELKERVTHIITVLHEFLPSDFAKTAKLLKRLPTLWDRGPADDPLRGFAAWPLIDYVGTHGLEHPEIAFDTLEKLTELFSAEFAIRPLLLAHPEIARRYLNEWSVHSSEHVRRLASEGTRPRLPWGIQLKPFIENPKPNVPLLDTLKNDPSLYVRRSVANHLNDIAKDHPDTVIELCKKWCTQNAPEEVRWVIRHATRTLVKAGHPEVFPLLGYSEKVAIKKPTITLSSSKLTLGDSLSFSLNIQSQSTAPQKLVIDFALHLVKANGRRQAKVFKLKSLELAPKQLCQLTKVHPIKPISTRKYYSGTQVLEILVNGKGVAECEFELRVP